MRIDQSSIEGVTVLRLEGKLTFGEGAADLRERVGELADGGCRQLVIDLEGAHFVDSTGIEALVGSHFALQKQGGRLRLASASAKLIHLLEITNLHTVLDLSPSSVAAVTALKQASE